MTPTEQFLGTHLPYDHPLYELDWGTIGYMEDLWYDAHEETKHQS